MPEYPHHESLRLVNFTAFEDASFEFSPTINVLVGENGTGKTHLMKALYAVQYTCHRRGLTDMAQILAGAFQDTLDDLLRSGGTADALKVEGAWAGRSWEMGIESRPRLPRLTFVASDINAFPTMTRPVFIPAIDMIGHTRKFVSTYDEYQIDFDLTHRDIVALLLAPERRQGPHDPEVAELLERLIGGTMEEEGERFYLRTPRGRQPMPLVAEGLRKIATLYQLIRNGFLEPGSVLFWDEPEVNVNPKLMDEIVDVLLRLARSGVQIFLSTHSYVILKELDLQAAADDRVRYFALEPTEQGTRVHQSDDYATLEPNPIAEQFDSLYDRELTKSIHGRRSR